MGNLILKSLESLDLEPIMVKAIDKEEGYGWDINFVKIVASEYKKFLTLCIAHPDEPIVPSSIIDKLWHLHILDTQKYQDDCQKYVGYFLHHFPYFGMRGDDDKKNLITSWENTLLLYEEMFGQIPNIMIWCKYNRCPNCGRRGKNDSMLDKRPTLSSVEKVN